jgi:dolichyl-diphosphooligosaccharide--protein glycosyltransferase
MVFITDDKRRPLLIGGLILLFMGIALVLRMIPALFIPGHGFLANSGADVWYTMRQIEVMVAHFPQYNWFDPMTAYPVGKTIDWGPFYPFLAASLCLLLGASSRPDIVNISGWIIPIMAALMVPVTYKLGKLIWDWKAGIIAAGLISVLSSVYFIQSSYGWMDHHVAEVFFVALFFLAYLSALASARQSPLDLKVPGTFISPVLFSALAGILYFFGYLTSPTVLLSLLVVAVTTFVQFFVDYIDGRQSEYLLMVNSLAFSCILILEILFGFPGEGLSLITYSFGHGYVMLGLIAETLLLYGLVKIFYKNRGHYFISLAGIVIGGVVLLQFLPQLQTIKDQAFSLVFGSSAYTIAIRETQAWTLSAAYDTFGLSLILMAGGILILAWYALQKRQGEQIFLLIWLGVMLILTVPHQRFEVYLAAPVALAAAICTAETIRWSWEGAGDLFRSRFSFLYDMKKSPDSKSETTKKERKAKKTVRDTRTIPPISLIKGIILITVIIIALLAFVSSAVQDYSYVAATPGNTIPKDWGETLGWMKTSTPPTGVDYFGTYDRQTFTYPNTSYGMLAPWEQGHRITFFAERLPITNPFQNHLEGSRGVAAYYLSSNETSANRIFDSLGGRYVITDLGTATDTFPSLIPWMTNTDDISPYIYWFFVPDTTSPSGLKKTHLLGDSYYQSMIVRLQVFDGSMVTPDTAQFVKYTVRSVPDTGDTAGVGGMARVVTGTQTVKGSQEIVTVSRESSPLTPGVSYSDIFSSVPYQPVRKVPALNHYRLVHESPTNISVQLFGSTKGSGLPDIRLVKVFEYVNGAHIPGDGVIELNLVTNTGRSFVYRQESSGGEFIVPYATEGISTEVMATGPYHIEGTSRYITVMEADVLNGSTVSRSG